MDDPNSGPGPFLGEHLGEDVDKFQFVLHNIIIYLGMDLDEIEINNLWEILSWEGREGKPLNHISN